MPPRIALIHAMTVAMALIERAFAGLWPEAERVNLLDDALARPTARGTPDPAMGSRASGLD
ncbi:MAG: hypothetical protein ACREIR_10730 [Geminicoccaceae bacterium]